MPREPALCYVWEKLREERPFETTGLFEGIVDIHGSQHRNPFNFKRLGKNQACNNRRNYRIINNIFV